MKKNTLLVFILCFISSAFMMNAQQQTDRFVSLQNKLEAASVDIPELTEELKLEINVSNVKLTNFLVAVSQVHKINLSVSPELQNLSIVNNFSKVTIADLLLFLCKEYMLTVEFTGNILAIKKYTAPQPKPKEKPIEITYAAVDETISLDLKNDPLGRVFRKIIDLTGKNLLYQNNMEQLPLNLYLKEVPVEKALETLASSNNLRYSKTRDGFYLYDQYAESSNRTARTSSFRNSDLQYEVLDTIRQIIKVDFNKVSIASIVEAIGFDLQLNIYTATPLQEAGTVTFKTNGIEFDELLRHMFESAETASPTTDTRSTTNVPPNNQLPRPRSNAVTANTNTKRFSFKKEGNIYFFGTKDQLSVRNVEVIPLMHRSVELLGDPSNGARRSAGRTTQANVNYYNGQSGNFQNRNTGRNPISPTLNTNRAQDNFTSFDSKAEALVNILPDEIVKDLDIKIDFELNSFLVSGPSANINRFKTFVKEIDKPVPYVLIEVMLIEVSKSSTVETGISWGLGEQPAKTSGNLFPTTDITLGAESVNKIIGGFDGFGSFNIGKVVPEFFAKIKAMEADGNVKIRSTPKLSTLNGHRAHLSIGETTYYVVTNQNFYGSQIPQSSEIKNYQPIDAELGLSIKPLVSGDGQVTLDIHVVQSDFNGERIDNEAPPGLNSREFSSIIRMRDQDVAILGGLEEKIKNDSGNGVPLLARIPVIKWLFSSRKREDTKKKLTVLIKPTVIY